MQESSSSNSSYGGSYDIPGMPGASMGILNVGDLIAKSLGVNKTKLKKFTIRDAKNVLMHEESEKLVDEDMIIARAVKSVAEDGIVFLDEIDKIAQGPDKNPRTDVSREGVQRDLLPLIEGTTVSTKHGPINTDHILFIASGAFHLAKPSDLLPELQGRLPIRVELKSLSKEDYVNILMNTESSLVKQYQALLATEGVTLIFGNDAIEEIAHVAEHLNKEIENIGARRLHTILEKVLEETSFNARDLAGQTVTVDADFVKKQVESIKKNIDLSKFIL